MSWSRRTAPSRGAVDRRALGALAVVVLALQAGVLFGSAAVYAASVSSVSISGGANTASVGGVLYARTGASLTLSITTSSDTQCVELDDALDTVLTSGSGKTTWTYTFTAPSGSGTRTVKVKATPKSSGGGGGCSGSSQGDRQVSFVLDNTGPVLAGTTTPAPNGAGWNRTDATVNWTAVDGGSGVASGPTPAASTQTANTAGQVVSASATDRVGNSATGSVTVKLDKAAPAITGSRTPAPNASGWNNTEVAVGFSCSDPLSGVKSCTGGQTLTSTPAAGQTVTGSAEDTAGNTATAAVGPVRIDTDAPTLSGRATTEPGPGGWYTDDVTIRWAAADERSGLDGGAPADSTITAEGEDLTVTRTVADLAGNETTAASAPVKVDRTAPATTVSAPEGWNRSAVDVELAATDNLSGVAATTFRVDGGEPQTGTTAAVAGDGVHALEYWSTDGAGNAEPHKTVDVRIDGEAPTITAGYSRDPDAHGWYRDDVTVTFTCADATSGVASCGPDRAVTTEGAGQDVEGSATDNAGNAATAHGSVSLDRTPPAVTATADRGPNEAGWYADDVTVAFAATDELSGVDTVADAATLGEGSGQTATGTATDVAGNEGRAELGGIDVDKTAPVLSGKVTTEPNADGWYAGDVTVHWTASDARSGLAGEAPADATVDGEGDGLSASATVADRAGHVSTETVGALRIDRTAPTTAVTVGAPLDSGWYAGAVKVTLDARDNLSGVKTTTYRVDDGGPQAYDGPFSFATRGVHTITFSSVDAAGNREPSEGNAVTLRIDGNAPSITGSRSPAANGAGWSNVPVTVSFACDDAESGVAACSEPVTLSGEGAGQQVGGSALDNAGNGATTEVGGINIDTTAPELAGVPTTDANAGGWYNGDVRVHWEAADALSGPATATVPADGTITGEGVDLATGPVTVADQAGNTTTRYSQAVRIDRTAPEVSGAASSATAPSDGWYRDAVVVDFTCTDALSGVASCPTSKTLAGDGTGQSVTSDPATDVAGNASAAKVVGAINIDGTAPATTADNQCTKTNGFCTGSTADVVLTADDQPGLSGVKELRYRVNGGAEQVAAGATKTIAVPLSGSGTATVEYWAVDRAGNVEGRNAVGINHDSIAPTVTHTLTPAPNALDWSRADTTVHFDAKDNDAGSGLVAGSITPDARVTTETDGAGRLITGSAKDLAGNLGTDAVTVRLDKTAPTITGAVVTGTKTASGWYRGTATVRFTCADTRSGIADKACPDDVTVTKNGAAQSVAGTVLDRAGNSKTATVGGLSVDGEKPIVQVAGVKDGGVYTLGAVPAASCAALDSFSGAASCKVTVTGGLANGVGTFTYTATGTDKAGNVATATGSYKVRYRFDGVLPPINDTARQRCLLSVFKAGSTVPVKFQLKRADGTPVQATAAPVWLAPVKGAATTAPVNAGGISSAGDSGSSFRYDAKARQYVFNWGTSKTAAGSTYVIGVRLDDGQTYTVNVGLR